MVFFLVRHARTTVHMCVDAPRVHPRKRARAPIFRESETMREKLPGCKIVIHEPTNKIPITKIWPMFAGKKNSIKASELVK